MILIADSGSFKTDWILKGKQESLTYQTAGLNPYFISEKTFHKELSKSGLLDEHTAEIPRIEFYGAGCGSAKNQAIVKGWLSNIFPKASIQVYSDLLGAARALLFNKPGIACILGTGSNCCFYDGKKITYTRPSPGYILGDEGSGSYMGQKLMKAFIYGELPTPLNRKLTDQFQLTEEKIVEALYNKPFPNRFLAGFIPFIKENKDHEFIQQMIHQSLQDFFEDHLIKTPGHKESTIRFTGSVAWIFQQEIRTLNRDFNLHIEHFIASPVQALAEFHSADTPFFD